MTISDTTGTFGATGTGTATTTGSWADSTHSVIWMTREGQKPSKLGLVHRPWRENIISLILIAVVSLLGAANLIDVYGSALSWAAAAVPATLIGVLIALAGMIPALRIWWQIVFLAVGQFVIGPVLALNETTIGHIIPSLTTLSQGAGSTFGSFKYLISITPPTGVADGSLMAVWTICLWTGLLGGIFATASDGRLSMISVLPIAANLSVCALLGTSTGYLRIGSGIAIGILVVIWLSWRWRLLELHRLLSAGVIVVLAASLAAAGCLFVAQDRTILRDAYEPPISPYDYTSPLSGMRAYIKNHKDDKLLTVTNLPARTPVRLAVMDRFDGNVWNLSDSRESADSSDYRRVGTSIANTSHGNDFTATFTLDKGLADDWLPLAGSASSVAFGNDSNAGQWYYNTDTQSAIIPGGVHQGLTYTESGTIENVPTDKQLGMADAAHIIQPQADDVPSSVGKLATAAAGGKASDGEAALALVSELKDNGWFSHGLSGDYPSSPGHGNYRVNLMLNGSAMVGDSEQYASAMALMARELGLPSRVVLGFLPKDESGDLTDSRTVRQADGTSATTFTGNDVTAWVEIKFADYGWVALYPTPKETKVPDQNQNLTPPNPQTLVRQPAVPLTDPLRDENQARGQSSLAGEDADGSGDHQLWARVGRIASKVALYGSPLWTVLIICGLILLIKAVQLSRMRRHGSARRRVTSGWQAICALARDSGVTVSGTRRDQTQDIVSQLNIDAAMVSALGREADYAAFSGAAMSDEQAGVYWKAVDRLRGLMLNAQPRMRRIRTRLSLADMLAGHRLRHILSSIRFPHIVLTHHGHVPQERSDS